MKFSHPAASQSASNAGAIRLYRKLGYSGLDGVALDAPAGATYFANKKL